jgi:hypothetical protein
MYIYVYYVAFELLAIKHFVVCLLLDHDLLRWWWYTGS